MLFAEGISIPLDQTSLAMIWGKNNNTVLDEGKRM
jgi:hypothetical protein